ncbi:MAG: M28 family peptidase, partial [Vulcanimicrobiaceae bacterium]
FERAFSLEELRSDLNALCDFGGRFAGTESELSARQFVEVRLHEVGAGRSRSVDYPYSGWERGASSVELGDGTPIESTSLVLSPSTAPEGLELELIDLGRGTSDDFIRERERLRGRAVLVRHEFPFTVHHVHRRRKYDWAKRGGAAAFCIANYLPEVGVVSGSSGRGDSDDIPAVGLSYEGGATIAASASGGLTRIRLRVEGRRVPMQGRHVVYEIPGQTDEWVVVCAHLDGHHLAESALDNATGAASVLEIGRRLGPLAGSLRRGLRLMLFTFEEWGLYGSSRYVGELSQSEREKIALVVNLDTIVGSDRLSALISEMEDVGRFVERHTRNAPIPVDIIRPVMGNSDHYNFFLGGIPSFRLIAGYEDPGAQTRFLLTPADTRARIDVERLLVAAQMAGRIAYEACASEQPIAAHLDADAVRARLDTEDPWVADRVKCA